jgi:hypothetical protein
MFRSLHSKRPVSRLKERTQEYLLTGARNLCTVGFNNLYSSTNIIRTMKWAGHIACMSEEKCAQNMSYTIRWGKTH